MPLLGSVDSPQRSEVNPIVRRMCASVVFFSPRFHKIVWSGHLTDEPRGLIIGGSDNGVLTVWSAAKVAR